MFTDGIYDIVNIWYLWYC